MPREKLKRYAPIAVLMVLAGAFALYPDFFMSLVGLDGNSDGFDSEVAIENVDGDLDLEVTTVDGTDQEPVTDDIDEVLADDDNIIETGDTGDLVDGADPNMVTQYKGEGIEIVGDEDVQSEVDYRDNPYWGLPNDFAEKLDKPIETWTVEQEDAWRENLSSKFIWQKYKTLDEIKDARLAGSEILLWDLVGERKLWLRLKALMALADFGEKVSIKDVLDASIDARPSTLANFVKRFRQKSSVGELFVLRQLIRIMDQKGRFEVLRVLAERSDIYTDLYLVAGAMDPEEKIAKWAERKLENIDPEKLEQLSFVVKGKAEFKEDAILEEQPQLIDDEPEEGKEVVEENQGQPEVNEQELAQDALGDEEGIDNDDDQKPDEGAVGDDNEIEELLFE